MSDCACLYDNADGDQPAFYTDEFVKARKPHTCCECGETIPPKAVYRQMSGKWDHGMQTYRTCAVCHDIRQSLYCEGWTFGQLWEDVEEQIFRETGLTVACIDKLTTPESKAYLQQRWMAFVEDGR